MINFLRTILHPERYHGHGKEPPLFEGWYCKLVDPAEQHPYAIIPGIFLSHDPARHHAFVQVLDGVMGRATYHTYPADEFWAAEDDFELRIGPNHFAAGHIALQIDDAERTVAGELRFVGLKPWPVSLSSPGIMGWCAWMPFMECYRGVVSLDHKLEGALTIDGEQVDFTGECAGGRGAGCLTGQRTVREGSGTSGEAIYPRHQPGRSLLPRG